MMVCVHAERIRYIESIGLLVSEFFPRLLRLEIYLVEFDEKYVKIITVISHKRRA